MLANTKVFTFLEGCIFYRICQFDFLTCLCVFTKIRIISRRKLNLITYVKQRNFWSPSSSANANVRTIVSFTVTFFRAKSLSHFNVIKKPVNFFTSKIKICFGCWGLLLNAPHKRSETLAFEPIETPPVGLW